MKEFSKKIVFMMIILWFLAAGFGMAVVIVEPSMLESLLSYIGMPVSGAIIGYLTKSAFENREKIRKETKNAETNLTDK